MNVEKTNAAIIKFIGGVQKALEDKWKPGEKIPSWLETRIAEVGEAILEDETQSEGVTGSGTDKPNDAPTETSNPTS